VTRLQQNLLRRELTAESRKDPDVGDDVEDFAIKKLRKQAKREIRETLSRLIYRAKYNLPPNDPRFLDLTDEDIVYDLVLQSEFRKWSDDTQEEETEDNKTIYRNTEEFESIAKRLERGEDIDLESMMTPDENWEKVDGS
jgi:hypothetical protein